MKKILHATILLFFFFSKTFAQTPVLWGMTSLGGAPSPVDGSIFSLNGDGNNFMDRFAFSGDNGLGYIPLGNVTKAFGGKILGMTTHGGIFSTDGTFNGFGTIFSYDSISFCTTLYEFDSINGKYPNGNLIVASNGLFYGLTSMGGANNNGVIFSFDTISNTFTKLYDFNIANGSLPNGSLIQATNGKLYGTTPSGGAFGYWVVFSYNISSNIYSDLHDFDSTDGAYLMGNLIQAFDGSLYGLTSTGGVNGSGVIFSIDTAGSNYTKLFDLVPITGAAPTGSLIQANDSIFYGLTSLGGVNNFGVLFSYNSSTSAYTDLHDMDSMNGKLPLGSLIQASDNNLYGTTCFGGSMDDGTIFSFNTVGNVFSKIHDFQYIDGKCPHGDLVELSQTNETTTSLNKLSTSNNPLSIYPNPASKEITISETDAINTIRITNIIGEVLLDYNQTNSNSTIQHLDVNTLLSGVYFVTVSSDNYNATSKLIIIK